MIDAWHLWWLSLGVAVGFVLASSLIFKGLHQRARRCLPVSLNGRDYVLVRSDADTVAVDADSLVRLRSANVLRQKEWPGASEITPSFRAMELAGEVGELCNVVKKHERERLGLAGSRATREMLEEEIADVDITLDLLAMGYGVDRIAAMRKKFNESSAKLNLRTRL